MSPLMRIWLQASGRSRNSPIATPAAAAAPRLVALSEKVETSWNVTLHTSARICFQSFDFAPPPMMRRSWISCRSRITSRIWLSPQAVPSRTARRKCSRLCVVFIPKKTPCACASKTGERSPSRYGR